MPEGPELEAARRLVAENVLGLKIGHVVIKDCKVFEGRAPEEVRAALEGRRIIAARRKAKYLWLEFDGEGPALVLHFGMTGAVVVEGVGAAKYVNAAEVDTDVWPPKYCKMEIIFDNHQKLAFTDPRLFGKVLLRNDPLNEEPISKLGFDVIDELPNLDKWSEHIKARQRPGSQLRIKALLLDQTFTAGVGNWVADEVLYQARIHPEQPVADMPDAQIASLHQSIKEVMRVAVQVANADAALFPPAWIFHFRWTGKRASSVGGRPIEFVTVGSRTSAFVPTLQKVISGTGMSSQKVEPKQRSTAGAVRKPRKKKVVDEAVTLGDPAGKDHIKLEIPEEIPAVIKEEATAPAVAAGSSKFFPAATAPAAGAQGPGRRRKGVGIEEPKGDGVHVKVEENTPQIADGSTAKGATRTSRGRKAAASDIKAEEDHAPAAASARPVGPAKGAKGTSRGRKATAEVPVATKEPDAAQHPDQHQQGENGSGTGAVTDGRDSQLDACQGKGQGRATAPASRKRKAAASGEEPAAAVKRGKRGAGLKTGVDLSGGNTRAVQVMEEEAQPTRKLRGKAAGKA